MSRVIFRFSFDLKHHADIVDILESIPKSMRTLFIAEVIRYSMSRVMQIPFERLANLNKTTSEKKIDSSEDIEKFASKENQITVKTENKLSSSDRHDSAVESNKPEKQSSDSLSVSLKNVFSPVNSFLKKIDHG